MRTIESEISCEIEIKNSRFICYLFPIMDEDINQFLNHVKDIHPKATHYCYAYIQDGIKHSSDDGEPGGTAGMPILNVLEKEDLNYVLAIVVRYFGGIKLGAGGLVRAYTKSVTETLKNASYIDLIPGYQIQVQFPYEDEKDILYILNDSSVLDREYLEKITYTALVDVDIYKKLEKYSPKTIKTCMIKKLR